MGADHNFSTRGDAEVEQKLCNTAGQIAARLSVDDRRDPAKTELMLNYDSEKGGSLDGVVRGSADEEDG